MAATVGDKDHTGTTDKLIDAIEALGQRIVKARDEIGGVIFGLHQVVEETVITLLAGGHVLLIGVPGLGKTR